MAEKESDPVSDTVATDLVVTKYKMAAEMVNSKFYNLVRHFYTLFRSLHFVN